MRFEISAHPLWWIFYFPVGLLVLSLFSFLVAVTWPLYLVHMLGKYTIMWARSDM
jgi:hypothetical protein